tara:strand:- start:628 stop:1089 length:462 start_codon:yes stop_codon:yes gene_type:complete
LSLEFSLVGVSSEKKLSDFLDHRVLRCFFFLNLCWFFGDFSLSLTQHCCEDCRFLVGFLTSVVKIGALGPSGLVLYCCCLFWKGRIFPYLEEEGHWYFLVFVLQTAVLSTIEVLVYFEMFGQPTAFLLRMGQKWAVLDRRFLVYCVVWCLLLY